MPPTWPPPSTRRLAHDRTWRPSLLRLVLKKALPWYSRTRQLRVASLPRPSSCLGRSRRESRLHLRQSVLAVVLRRWWVLLTWVPNAPPSLLSRPTPVLRTWPYRLLRSRTSDPHPAETLAQREARTCRLLRNFRRPPPYLLPWVECLTTLLTRWWVHLPLPRRVPRNLPPRTVSVLRTPL